MFLNLGKSFSPRERQYVIENISILTLYRRRLAALDPSSRGNSHVIFRIVLTQVRQFAFARFIFTLNLPYLLKV